jgi:hypothetical protein
VLQECIQRAGSVEAGLRFYVGAANLEGDGGYADKVLAEHGRLKLVAAGKSVPLVTPATPSAPAPVLRVGRAARAEGTPPGVGRQDLGIGTSVPGLLAG